MLTLNQLLPLELRNLKLHTSPLISGLSFDQFFSVFHVMDLVAATAVLKTHLTEAALKGVVYGHSFSINRDTAAINEVEEAFMGTGLLSNQS